MMDIAADPKAFVVPAEADRMGTPLAVFGNRILVKTSSRDTGGAFCVMVGRTEPMQGPPLHLHHEHDECWYVLEGRFLFEVDGQKIYGGPGDTIFARRGTRHRFQNIGETPGTNCWDLLAARR